MPPTGKLPEAEINTLVKWIAAGAPGLPAGERNAEAPRHWSFQPVRRPTLPRVKDAAWIKTPIDAFALAKLEAKGLAPSPPADPRTLIRRATFDLTGLPPTPEEVEAFVRDIVIPFEQDPRRDHHGAPTDGLVFELKDKARAAGVLSPCG